MFPILLASNYVTRMYVGMSAMTLLFVVFIISLVSYQRKKLQHHKEVQALNEREQQILTEQNTLLEQRVKERTAEINQQKEALEKTLTDLRSAQLLLVQREKMASLGELTAGIAHEIQNPLNFVNNFSEVNTELLTEIREQLSKENLSAPGKDNIDSIIDSVNQNLEKINHHGRRADGIVKGMLLHSRSSSGSKEPVDINALTDEYLRLGYHGLRAKDKSFNANFTTDFDPTIGKLDIVQQDIGRVLINLFNNAFYSVNEKKKTATAEYAPLVTVSTRKVNNRVHIKVRDNGLGIPKMFIDRIYHPFFTTKPAGQGTGLGLSLSYDIIKAHQGELILETVEGELAEFTIIL